MSVKGKEFLKKLNLSLVIIYLAFLLFDLKIVNIVLPLVFITSFLNYKDGLIEFKDYFRE